VTNAVVHFEVVVALLADPEGHVIGLVKGM
jgi:hypothetical protein